MEEGCFFLRDFLRVYVLYEYLLWENLYFYKTTHNWSIINIFHTDFKFVLGKYFVKIIIVLAQLLFSQYFLWVLKISCGNYPHSRRENNALSERNVPDDESLSVQASTMWTIEYIKIWFSECLDLAVKLWSVELCEIFHNVEGIM